ncbi:MAG: hypothetical protein L0H83_07330 [Salinisphaera sp.]|nr:hypothetical protein [Salinisphaera sp.]
MSMYQHPSCRMFPPRSTRFSRGLRVWWARMRWLYCNALARLRAWTPTGVLVCCDERPKDSTDRALAGRAKQLPGLWRDKEGAMRVLPALARTPAGVGLGAAAVFQTAGDKREVQGPVFADSHTRRPTRRFALILAAALPLAAFATQYPFVTVTGSAGANTVIVTGRMASMHYGESGLEATLTDGRVVEIARVTTLRYDGHSLTVTYVVDPIFYARFEGTP